MIKKETDIFGLLFLRDGDTITRTLLLNIMELGAQDWKYSIFLRYGINVPEFTPHCNGCGAAFYICYALECKKGGLITAHHNELCDGVVNLAGKAFTPAHVRGDPKIFTSRSVWRGKAKRKAKGKGTESPPP